MIERKAAGQEIVVEPEAPTTAKCVDLMAALEASLAAAKKRKSTKPAAKPEKKVEA